MDTNPSQLRSTHAHSSSSPLPKSELPIIWLVCVTPFRTDLIIHVKEFFHEEATLDQLVTSIYRRIKNL